MCCKFAAFKKMFSNLKCKIYEFPSNVCNIKLLKSDLSGSAFPDIPPLNYRQSYNLLVTMDP